MNPRACGWCALACVALAVVAGCRCDEIAYDPSGNAVWALGGCEESTRAYGRSPGCKVVRERKLCDEVKATLAVDGVRIAVLTDNRSTARVDGMATYERSNDVYPLGVHTAIGDGVELELTVEAASDPLSVRVRATSRTPGALVAFEHPDGRGADDPPHGKRVPRAPGNQGSEGDP